MSRPTPEHVEMFSKLERQRVQASRDSDTELLSRLMHADFVFIHSNGRIDGRGEYLELLDSGALSYSRMESSDLEVRSASDQLATVLTRINLDASYLGKQLIVSALVLTVWVSDGSTWQALSIQSTPVPMSQAR